MAIENCPNRDTLEKYLQGQLDGPSEQQVESHLETCQNCEETIVGLETPTHFTLGRKFSEVSPVSFVEDDGISHLASPPDSPPNSTASDQNTDSLAGKTLREYRLIELIGQGGMGSVYRAEHVSLGRIVAVKVLPAESLKDESLVSRFRREIRAVGKLDHPHIVRATDAGEVDGIHFLAMELIDGPNLTSLISRRGPLSVSNACEIIRQAALGLQEAYSIGLVHRDIKPSNLLLDSKGIVKILDLGLALLHEEADDPHSHAEQTTTGQIMGTADYMAPEQALDTHAVDIRADIYSLGCTLFFLLTGRPPYRIDGDRNALKTLMRHANDPVPDVRTERLDVPDELAHLLSRMMAKNPKQRPSSPSAVAESMLQFAHESDRTALGTNPPESLFAKPNNSGRPTLIAQPADSTAPTTLLCSEPASTPSGMKPRKPLIYVALSIFFLMGFGVIYRISTDYGDVVIEVDPAIAEEISVSVLREGKPIVEGWEIEPGEKRSRRIRTGDVEVTIPGDLFHEYELSLVSGSLSLSRNGKTAFKIRRIETNDSATPEHFPDNPAIQALVTENNEWEWIGPERVEGEINSNRFEAQPTLSGDGLSMIYSANGTKEEDGLNLWESTRPTLNDPWGTPKELDAGINSDFYEMWPCLSFDGLTLLFSTWRPDSIGGYDLYRSTRKSKEEPWSAPVNLGSEINTPANESGPCLSRTGQELIYMSNRSGGEGGVDLWISKRVDDQWSKPQLIGGKINSDLDDFDARLCMNDNVLVFNRNDLGGTTGITTWIAARKDANSSWSNPKEIPFLSRIHAQSVNLLPSSNKEIVFSSHKYSTDQDVRRFRLVSKQGATPTAESERHSASYSLEFDGVDDYVEVDMRRFILNTKQTITVEGWFWIDEVSEKTQSVVRLSNSVLGPEFRILVDPKKSGGRINASWAIRSDPASAKPEFRWHDSYANLSESLGKWVHIAATFQRGVRNPSLYVNGQVSSVRDAGLYIFKEHEVLKERITIGRENGSFRGKVEVFRISAGQKYNGPFDPPATLAAEPDTLILYDFREGQGEQLLDKSGNGHHGTIHGANWVKVDDVPPPPEGGHAITPETPTEMLRPAAWEPGSPDDVLPGLVAQPAKVLNGKRWNVVSASPEDFVSAAEWSPNGLQLAVGSLFDKAIRIYRRDHRQLILESLFFNKQGTHELKWSPDGNWLAVVSTNDQSVRIWNSSAFADGPKYELRNAKGVAWSPDSSKLVVNNHKQVWLWDYRTDESKSLCQLPSPSHAGRFHPDGSQVAFQCGGRYPTHIEFYDLTGKHVRTLDLNMKPGASFGWNTDGTYFFAVSNNNVPAVWETDNWTPIALKNVPGGTHSSATFSQNDPLQLACVYYHGADARQYVAIHRVPGGELVSTVNLPRLVDGNWHPWVSWAGDGLLTAVRDGTVYLCDSTNGDVIQTLGCEKSLFMGADSFNWSGDNSRLSSIHMDGTTRIWSATGEPVAILRTHSRKKPTAAILNHDGTGLLVHGVPLTNDGKTFIRYFDVATGERKYEILGEWRSDQLPPLARHPEHDSFAFVGLDPRDTEKETPRIQIWNADDRTSSWIVGLPSGRVSSLSWMPDGVTLAIGFAHGTIELWNSQSSTQTWSQKVNREVIGIQPDQKGRVLAVQDTEQVTALDASTGEQLWTQKWHSGNPTHLQSGIWLTAAGELGILQQGQPSILSFPTGTPVRSLSSLGWSSRVVASSDGKKLAANRNAKALLVWDLEESSPLWTGQAVTEEASVSLTPGGQIIGSRGDLEGQLAWAIENGENDLELVDQEEFLKRVTRQEEGTQIEPAGKNAN